MDFLSLEGDVQHFLEAGVAKSTMNTYEAGWSRYQKFTSQFHLTPHPITEEKVMLFIAHVGAQGLAASTIKVYLAGLRLFRLLTDPTCTAPSFHNPYVNLLIRGIRRVNAGKGPARNRLPITMAMMNRIRAALAMDSHSFQNRALWAACCVFLASYAAASSWHQTQARSIPRYTYAWQTLCMSMTRHTIILRHKSKPQKPINTGKGQE